MAGIITWKEIQFRIRVINKFQNQSDLRSISYNNAFSKGITSFTFNMALASISVFTLKNPPTWFIIFLEKSHKTGSVFTQCLRQAIGLTG